MSNHAYTCLHDDTDTCLPDDTVTCLPDDADTCLPDDAGEGGVPAPGELGHVLQGAGVGVQAPDPRPVLPQREAHQVRQVVLPGGQEVQQGVLLAPEGTTLTASWIQRMGGVHYSPGSVLATR